MDSVMGWVMDSVMGWVMDSVMGRGLGLEQISPIHHDNSYPNLDDLQLKLLS